VISISRLLRNCNQYCVNDKLRSQLAPKIIWKASPKELCADLLDSSAAKGLIAALSVYGIKEVKIEGCERFLDKDLFELLYFAQSLGIKITMLIKGESLDQDEILRLLLHRVSHVEICPSLESDTDRTLKASRVFQNADLPAIINIQLTESNMAHLENAAEFLHKGHLHQISFSPVPDPQCGPDLYRKAIETIFGWTETFLRKVEICLSGSGTEAAFLYVLLKMKNELLAQKVKPYLEKWVKRNEEGIGLGFIDHKGTVFPGPFWSRHELGSLRLNSFEEIWERTDHEILNGLRQNKIPSLKGACFNCVHNNFCRGGIRGRADSISGDPWAQDPHCYLYEKERSSL
jgi:radical SAM protein with 4Fe4S-binding SPASM domain